MNSLAVQVLLAAVGLALAAAAPAPEGASTPTPVPIVRSAADGPHPDGSYSWSFEAGNGIRAEEQGELRPAAAPADEPVASVRGSYSYRADDGTPVEISYTADEQGFRPRGAAIPQPPEIPASILRALEWIAAHPEEDDL